MHPRGFPDKVHSVPRKLANGKTRYHFYAWRGGPKFWTDTVQYPTSLDFTHALADATTRPKPADYMTHQMVDNFLSGTGTAKAERSRADQRKWVLRFADAFKDAPAAIFEDRRSRGKMNEWRANWKHSPKQHDAAGTHAVRVLNWAVSEGKLLEHHCHKLHRLYEVDRSEIVGRQMTSKGTAPKHLNGRVASCARPVRQDYGLLI